MKMSFDYSRLRGKIVEKYGSQTAFAKALGVSQKTLSMKMNNKIFFAQDEINKTVELLDINPVDIDKYFFTPLCASAD